MLLSSPHTFRRVEPDQVRKLNELLVSLYRLLYALNSTCCGRRTSDQFIPHTVQTCPYTTRSSQAAPASQSYLTRKMVLGRLVHYTLDVVLVSTVLAGVKRHTGFQ